MASSNVQYYEKQKVLQDTMTKCEQQRLNLERELRLAHQADHTSAQMKASRLQTYWKKICDDEKRAKQRNEMLVREFERIDAHMAEMNARTQRLALMKKQYEDYIARSCPEWNTLMHGAPQQSQAPHGAPQQSQAQQQGSPQHEGGKPHKEKPARSKDKQTRPQSPQMTSVTSAPSPPPVVQSAISSQQVQHSNNSPQLTSAATSQSSRDYQTANKDYQTSQTVVPDYQQSAQHRESIYSTVEEEDEKKITDDRHDVEQHEEITHSHSSHIGEYANLPGSSRKGNDEVPAEGLTESSVDQEEEISHPIRSVEIQSRTSGRMVQSPQYTMEPPDEDDETSEFGTDSELPMAQSGVNTAVLQASRLKEGASSSIKPELSIDGLIRLLNMVENDFAEAFSLEGYYRSSWPDTARKNDIIRRSNTGDDLSHVDANLVSMVILEQITLIVRSLTEKCVLPESLLQRDTSSMSAVHVRQLLSPEAQLIWDSLYHHFQQLVRHRALEPPELSAIFTPSLVVEGGSQDKGHSFMVRLLEEWHAKNMEQLPRQSITTISPAQTMEGSASFMEDGVPPLKFGSLIESKQISDDESSYVKSIPNDPTPLNETDAYKNMLSGSSAMRRQPSSGPDDTDDDVEKQIATVLTQKPKPMSPKRQDMEEPSDASSLTQQTASHVYVPTAMDSRSPRSPSKPFGSNLSSGRGGTPKYQGVRISSDLDTDTEVDAGVFGSSKKPEDDFDFYD